MKRINGFFYSLCRENSRRYLLGLQTAAWVMLVAMSLFSATVGWLLSVAALIILILWKTMRSSYTGVRFDLQDAAVIGAGALNAWLWMLLIYWLS